VFQYPWEEDRDFIKRVIGLPGDRVQVRDRQVLVTDQPLLEPYARYTANPRQDTFGPVVVPKKGDRLEIRNDKRLYLNGEPVPIPSNPYHPAGLFQPKNDGSPMTGFDVFYGPLLPPGTTVQQTLAPHPVEYDCYFVLGDNRDNSQDSRYWGFVRSSRLKGRAFFIYWSWDREGSFVHHIRLDRLGKLLNLPAS
jgi:signal peptidase I